MSPLSLVLGGSQVSSFNLMTIDQPPSAVDLKSINDLKSMLDRTQARKKLTGILAANPNCFSYGHHFKRRLLERQMSLGDVLNVLYGGWILMDGELENGEWRYRVETERMVVVIAFLNDAHVRLVTCWRLT